MTRPTTPAPDQYMHPAWHPDRWRARFLRLITLHIRPVSLSCLRLCCCCCCCLDISKSSLKLYPAAELTETKTRSRDKNPLTLRNGCWVEMASGTASPWWPKSRVDKEQVKHLHSLQFTYLEWNRATFLTFLRKHCRGESRSGILKSILDDDTLDQIVQEIKSQFPRSGEVMIRGHLNSQKDRLSKFISLHYWQHHNRKKMHN